MNFTREDVAVRHMTRQHHKDIIYHDINSPNPKLQEIDTSSTPAYKYKELISDVFKEQLKEGLHEAANKKAQEQIKDQVAKSQYKKMCDFNATLEKNQIQKRRNYYNAIQDQQNRREHIFVDDPQVRNSKVQQHIKANQGNHLFYKLQEEYDDYNKHNQKVYRDNIFSQVSEKQYFNKLKRQQKENEVAHRKNVQEYICRLNEHQKAQQQNNKQFYKQQLDKLVEAKSSRISSKPQPQPHVRHNTITNPIDHHVENPYIMRKILQKLNRQR